MKSEKLKSEEVKGQRSARALHGPKPNGFLEFPRKLTVPRLGDGETGFRGAAIFSFF